MRCELNFEKKKIIYMNFGHHPREKNPRYPLNNWLGEPHSRPGRCGEEKISCLESNLGRPAHSPSLYRLSCEVIIGKCL
jgi:hypothetical protein